MPLCDSCLTLLKSSSIKCSPSFMEFCIDFEELVEVSWSSGVMYCCPGDFGELACLHPGTSS